MHNNNFGFKFWMVWNPRGYIPTVRHKYLNDARKEAERLARLQPNDEFFVVEAVEKYKIPEVPVSCTQLDEIPF